MDLLVLQRLASELDEALRGARILTVYALPKNDVVLVVGRRADSRLWFSTEPDHPHLYLRPGPHPTPKRPPGFAMAARNAIGGRRIAAVTWMYRDRVVELRCAGDEGTRVMFELIPRRATALIVDGDGIVIAAWQPRRGRPGLGEPYAPPVPDSRPGVSDVEDDVWEDLRAAPDDDALVRGLLRSISGMSPLAAREIACRHRAGAPLAEAARAELDRGTKEPIGARVYAPRPPALLSVLPLPREFFLAPYELSHAAAAVEAGSLHAERYATMCAAAASYYPLRASLRSLDTAREALVSGIDIGLARLQRTRDAVAGDACAAGNAEQHRRWADLLLAYPQAERDGPVARLRDPWASARGDAVMLEIPIDPARSLVDNAQGYYGRARRAERSAKRTAERRRRLSSRIKALRQLAAEATRASDLRDCLRLAKLARDQGVALPTDKWTLAEAEYGSYPAREEAGGESPKRKVTGRRPSDAAGPGAATAEDVEPRAGTTSAGASKANKPAPGIDRFESTDGFEILVGRNAKANERVTHKLAAPHDFWLHAEGPGSHVIIRNPQRTERPSETALREAASLAAYFSFARAATKVNVRWTQARRVKKPRGSPTGQVTLRQAETYLAEPLAPPELFGNDPEA